MPCIVAFIVLSVLGIFSASHRKLAREAFDCVFRRVTLRPCDTGFDLQVKAGVVSFLLQKFPRMAKPVNKYFELISWLIMIISVVSLGYFIKGVYNFYAWGNCDGPTSENFCVFDPTGENTQTSTIQTECSIDPTTQADLDLSAIPLDEYPALNAQSSNELVFIGCFGCEYTRETYPLIQEIVGEFQPTYRFVDFPVHDEVSYLTSYDYCVREQAPEIYFDFVDGVFALSSEEVGDEDQIRALLEELGLASDEFEACIDDPTTEASSSAQLKAIEGTGIYGTPTIFVNGQAVVGPKPARVYERLLRGGWF